MWHCITGCGIASFGVAIASLGMTWPHWVEHVLSGCGMASVRASKALGMASVAVSVCIGLSRCVVG